MSFFGRHALVIQEKKILRPERLHVGAIFFL